MRQLPFNCFLLVWLLLPHLGTSLLASIDFNRDVRPILSENCLYCHGQDANHRKADLRLDLRDAVMRTNDSGHAAVVPGNPEASLLIKRILTSDEDDLMPPPSSQGDSLLNKRNF
jgi:hypothetical protein